MMTEYRITVVGAQAVGKSTLAVQLIHSCFVDRYEPTIEDRYWKEMVIDRETCLLRIVDTTGPQEYSTLLDDGIQAGDRFLVVFSLQDVASFEYVHRYREKIRVLKGSDIVPMVLVGNKSDMEDPAVDSHQAQDRALCYNCPYVETSALTTNGVEEAFVELVREMRRYTLWKMNTTEQPRPLPRRRRRRRRGPRPLHESLSEVAVFCFFFYMAMFT
ncbi:hypothetical protein STEG23_012498 [Scotinomys teguina]